MRQNGPKKVALVALGPTAAGYMELASKAGSRRTHWDETWTCNKFTNLLSADRIFHMDDFRVQEARAAAGNHSIGEMLKEMKAATVPIMTSRAYAEYPMSEEFPLEAVINHCGAAYFNNTMPYALAYAMYSGVQEIDLFGLDYHWHTDSQKMEEGRACCEYWIGRMQERGMVVRVLSYSTLLNGGKPRFYGYDSRAVTLEQVGHEVRVHYSEVPIPSAAEIEKRYDPTIGSKSSVL